MSYEIKTRALVLRRYPYGEKSWILRLHTESEGTLHVLTSGSKQTIALPGALVHVNLRIRPHREVQRVTEMDWDYIYTSFFHDPRRTPYLLFALEWLSQCLYSPEKEIFSWLRSQLIALDAAVEIEACLVSMLADLLRRLGGVSPLPPITLAKLERAYANIFPNWKPISSYGLFTFASL